MPDHEVKQDAERYCAQAIAHGAAQALAVPADRIPVDDRVTLKCRVPVCFGYGTSANCPPHCLRPDETRKILTLYRWGVVLKLEVMPQVIVRDKATIHERVEAYQTVFRIVDRLESAAFYDGHYLALGFAAGSCKSTFCHDRDCAVLNHEKCRLALKARPSMEAVGIDCYRLATELGWTIFPIGSDAKPDCIASATLMGLVLVD